MKPPIVKKMLFIPILVLISVQLACSLGGQSANPAQSNNPAPQQPANSSPTDASAPSSSSAANIVPGQVVITGAISKTYTPVSYDGGVLGSNMIINIHESTVDGVSLAFPPDTKSGTYNIEDLKNQAVVDFSGQYSVFKDDAFYLSTKGTLTLTVVGSSYSGTFQFTAASNKDASKIIEVSGSFSNVAVKQ